MNKKLLTLLIAMFAAFAIISGCSSDDKETTKDSEKETEEAEETKEEPEETKEEPAEEKEDDPEEEPEEEEEEEKAPEESNSASSVDYSELIKYMEEETEGTAEIIYENAEEQKHETDSMNLTLNGYALLSLDDFHTNYSIPFDDNTDGGVVLAEYTIENTGDEEIYFMPDLHLEFTGSQKYHTNYDALLPEDVQFTKQVAPATDYAIKPGESITGYYAYAFSPEVFEKIQDLGTVTSVINKPHDTKGDVTSNFGKEGKFTLALSEEGEKKSADSKQFYEDKATYDNMGEKKMLKEKSDIGESQDLRDVKITLDGYQFTEFTPNEEEAPRFDPNFPNGVVLLTVKYELDNGGESDIALSGLGTKLTMNDGAQYQLSEGMLLNYRYGDVIAAGEADELLQVFVLDQEQYEKIWKDKAFEVEIGPLKDEDAKDISKGNKLTFTLPK